MAITRVTQNMMSQRSVGHLQLGLSRLADIQEQLSTGKILNRPSDSPTDASSAMRLRSSISDRQQYGRNAQDGLGWLGSIDGALSGMVDQLRRAHTLALQGANQGALGPAAREALATEVHQIREGLIASANTTYLDRPVFGGVTAGKVAYDATGTFVGTPGSVVRTIDVGVSVDVQVGGNTAFGPAGSSIFDDLTALENALRSGDLAGIRTGIGATSSGLDRLTLTLTDVGTRYGRLEVAVQNATDTELQLKNSLSEIENTDLPKAMVDLQMQEVAYQSALAATSRVLQPSLVDFLR